MTAGEPDGGHAVTELHTPPRGSLETLTSRVLQRVPGGEATGGQWTERRQHQRD